LARLCADENLPYPTGEALRRLGHDVLTVVEAGQAGRGIADKDVLLFAHVNGRAVLTHNRMHFRSLHSGGISHSGIVLCTEDADFDRLAARIHLAVSQTRELTGQLVRVTRPPG
jgi:predicted nuclease of predicted toxin-antitoxin system